MELDLAGVFLAGLLTLLSPCVLPLIPVYLATLLGGAVDSSLPAGGRWRLLVHTLLFSAGMLVVFVGLGLTATSIGRLLGQHRTELVILGGLVIFLFGLKFLGVLRLPWLDGERRLDGRTLRTRFGWVNAVVMGVVFSLGWTPCIGPILGSVLTYTASAASSPGEGALYLALYGLGLNLPLLVLALFAETALGLVRRMSAWLPRLERITGVLLVGVGLFLLLDAARPPVVEAGARPATAVSASRPGVVAAVDPPLGSPTVRPRLVQFTSPDCAICRQMIPTVSLLEHECGGREVDLVRVDVTRPESRQLVDEHQVRGVPTFLFLDQKGTVVARLVGYQTIPALQQALATLVGERCNGLELLAPPQAPVCQGGGGAAQCSS